MSSVYFCKTYAYITSINICITGTGTTVECTGICIVLVPAFVVRIAVLQYTVLCSTVLRQRLCSQESFQTHR